MATDHHSLSLSLINVQAVPRSIVRKFSAAARASFFFKFLLLSVLATGLRGRPIPWDRKLLKRKKSKWDDRSNGNDNKKTVFTIMKAFIASGILFLPGGVAKAGWLLAILILLLLGSLSLWCMLLLLDAKNKLVSEGVKVLSFGDVAKHSYGKWGRRAVDTSILFAQMGFCCAYLAFVGENLHSVLYSVFDCWDVPQPLIMLLLTPIIIPMVWVRKLKYYAVTNIIADVLIVAPLVYLLWYEADLVMERGLGPDIVACKWETALPFFGTTVYALEGISMIIPIEQAMKRPQDLPRVLTGCMVFIVSLMIVIGVSGYLTFGSDTKAIITLNLGDPTEGDNKVVDVIKLAYCLAIIFTYPLMKFPAVKIVERNLFKDRRSGKKWAKNFVRMSMVFLCLGVSIAGADKIDNFVAIVGGLTCVPLAFIFPSLFHYKICCNSPNSPAFFNYSYNTLKMYSWADVFIFIFGVLSMILSTGLAIGEWIDAPPKAEEICHLNTTIPYDHFEL
ncbi:hypothetical protein SARC_01433 [Sphaeroforma arctica JP610]|uniref:Amino acid transporter transmembrane domain-containing protein n=1 Tax=Sphaeroforma arctica JP610 TaxID=667725 RepID=A0A0L0GBN6_9EUKA|nr:hypothetical protein SARC_01433 [Sphaeroforma arctica JP610]KNC86427.1 hypothetical protein SARC_01433 [Sphaeroforma arctica JP610]|eukprot:XP_014160329.1 hypothetical protein SARC_01433 [Sphaeroforma arctica JP610]